MKNITLCGFADEASASLEGQIAALRRNGMRGLEIRNVDGENVSALSPDKAREIRRRLEDAGLFTWSLGSPIGKIDIEGDDFPAHMDTLRHTLEVGATLGARHLRMFSFYIPKGRDPAIYRDDVMERLARMAAAARGSGITLCHENEKGIDGLMLSNAMHLSAFLNSPVELPIDEDLYYAELMKRVATSRRKAGGRAVYADTGSSYGGT